MKGQQYLSDNASRKVSKIIANKANNKKEVRVLHIRSKTLPHTKLSSLFSKENYETTEQHCTGRENTMKVAQ